MIRKIALLTALTLAGACAIAQTDNTVYVKQFPGRDLGTKLTNAIAACPSATYTCVAVIDPSLAGFQPGTWPAIPSNVDIRDYRMPSQAGYTVATLPSSPYTGLRVTITDANPYCSAGGGSITVDCRWNGSSWSTVGAQVTAGVASFNSRTGAVLPSAKDYAPTLGSITLPPTSHYTMPAPTLYRLALTLADCTGGLSGMSNYTGGIGATTAGVSGNCTINLPNGPIDPTVPFRLVYDVSGPDGTNTTTVQLVNPNNAQAGWDFDFQPTSARAFPLYGGLGVFNSSSASVPNGTGVAVNVIGDGNFLTYSVVPLSVSASLFGTCTTFAGTWNGGLCAGGMGGRYVNATYGAVTAGLSQIKITTTSATNLIGTFYFSQGFIGGPIDGAANAPGFMLTNVGLQNTPLSSSAACGAASPCNGNMTFIPGNFSPNGTGFIALEHPNASFQMNANSYATIAALWNAGFALGDDENASPGNGANALSSPWGAQAGQIFRKLRTQNVKTNLPNIFQTGYYTNSMGCTSALAGEMTMPEGATSLGIYCVSGVLDTKASYNQTAPYTSFSSIIETAYGDLYLCIQAGTGQTPASSPAYWKHVATSPLGPGEGYLAGAPTFSFLGKYAAGTAYTPGQIVSVDRSDGSWPAALDPFNPSNAVNIPKFVSVPIKLSACATTVSPGDQVINPAQDVAFAAAVNALGGNVQTLYSSNGSCGHLTADVFNPTDAVNFFTANLQVNPPAQFGSTPAASPNTCTFPAACAGSLAQGLHNSVDSINTASFLAAVTQTVPLAANQNVDVECKLIWQSNNTGNGINFQISGFSGSNAYGSAQVYTNVGAVAPFLATGTVASGTLTFTGPTSVTAASTPYPAFVSARIFNGSTAGYLVLGFQPAPSGFHATIEPGSRCTVSPIQQ